eukprot:COSAG01_NODE_5685_length_4101_cov_98.783858_2_plen_113_part_00
MYSRRITILVQLVLDLAAPPIRILYGCTTVPVRTPYTSVVSTNPIRVLPYRYKDRHRNSLWLSEQVKEGGYLRQPRQPEHHRMTRCPAIRFRKQAPPSSCILAESQFSFSSY